MADFAGQVFDATPFMGVLDSFPGEILSSSVTSHFKMVGQDSTNNDLDTWRVTGAPDSTGAQYVGALATPLRNIAVAASWTQ